MPDEDRTCSHCRAWLCRGDDAWCGNCGRSCARLDLQVKPAVLHLGDEPPRLFFKLTNTTCAPISIRQIVRSQWLSFPVEQIAGIAPGASSGLLATADLSNILQPASSEVVFSTSVGDATARIMVIERRPQLVCNPDVVEAWAGPSGERGSGRVAVSPAAGMLIIRDVRLHGVPGAVRTEKLQGGFAASSGSGAPIEVEVQAERLGRGIQQAQLEVIFDGPHGPETSEVAIVINVRRPPQIRWAGEHERPPVRHQTDRQGLDLVFHNQSPDGRDGGSENAELLLRSIALTPPRGVAIPLVRFTQLPVSIPGGQSHKAEFELNLKGLQGQAGRLVEFGLEVQTNLQKSLKGTVSLRVEPMQRFEGVVAIDFGSSNTCCAVLAPGGEPELLRLDEDSLVSPTSVRYIDLVQTPPVIEAGSRARSVAAVNEEFAASVADGLKRKLRDREQEIDVRPLIPRKWMSRRASDAAADYLRNLRQLAETRKTAIFENFILTHPARCPLRQHHRLSTALLQAFGSNEFPISYISEPIAALVPYIAERAKRIQLVRDYNLARQGGHDAEDRFKVQYGPVIGMVCQDLAVIKIEGGKPPFKEEARAAYFFSIVLHGKKYLLPQFTEYRGAQKMMDGVFKYPTGDSWNLILKAPAYLISDGGGWILQTPGEFAEAGYDKYGGYTVASFDLGGGTTDLAIIQVSYEHPSPEELEIVPAIRYGKGVDFGGEDLTDYIKAQLEESCQALLDAGNTHAVVITEHVSAAAAQDIRRNRVQLRDTAEKFKASLSEESDKRELRPILLRVRQQDGKAADFPFEFAAASRQAGRDLKASFLGHAKMKVIEVAQMLKEAVQAKNVTLDVIQLSGKTALLPLVRQAIEEVFPGVRIERAPEPKECVVKGACLSQSMRIGRVRLRLPDSMERMTSSIGVFPPHSAYFVPLLKAEMEIPAEGLRREHTGFWAGSESVVLWEDVHGDDRPVEYASASTLLDRLGTWEPERKIDAARSQPWTLRLTVRKFEVSVEAIGADGDCVRFHPMHRTGE